MVQPLFTTLMLNESCNFRIAKLSAAKLALSWADSIKHWKKQHWIWRIKSRDSKEFGGVDAGDVSSAHGALAKEIAELVKQHVGGELVNAEQALDSVVFDFVDRLQRLDSDYHRAREQDIRDVGRRMMRNLSGIPLWTDKPLLPDSIIVARELMPSEIIELAQSGLIGVVCETGGRFSHTFILAQALGIPAITSISGVTSHISPGTRMLIDGNAGEIICNPTNADEKKFAARIQQYEDAASLTEKGEKLPCTTQDGVDISLVANIGRVGETKWSGQTQSVRRWSVPY